MTVCCTVQFDDRTGLATDVDYPFEEWVGSGLPNTCGIFSQIYRLWFVGGKHCGEDVAGYDEGGGHLCLDLYKILHLQKND